MTRSKFKLIDLFAGAGGLTLGFSEKFGNHFESVWANDHNHFAVKTYNANFRERCALGDLVNLLADPALEIPKADVVIGGPPCQGFSLLNKNRKTDPRKEMRRLLHSAITNPATFRESLSNSPLKIKSNPKGKKN